mmetsp:Transcript_164477/g.522936  ORF Transcript_164477/g.522936 Transcript_164477/m.522936 type:complete len:628 (+) Transcript_164477:56-1939(+)
MACASSPASSLSSKDLLACPEMEGLAEECMLIPLPPEQPDARAGSRRAAAMFRTKHQALRADAAGSHSPVDGVSTPLSINRRARLDLAGSGSVGRPRSPSNLSSVATGAQGALKTMASLQQEASGKLPSPAPAPALPVAQVLTWQSTGDDVDGAPSSPIQDGTVLRPKLGFGILDCDTFDPLDAVWIGQRLAHAGTHPLAVKSKQKAPHIAHQSQGTRLWDGFPRPVTPDSSGNSPVGRSASCRRRNLQRFVSGDTEGVGPRNRIDYTANQRSDEPPAHNDFKSLGLGRRLDVGIDPFAEKSAQKAPRIAHQSQEVLLVDGFPRLVTPDSSVDSPVGRSASPRRRNLQRLVSGDTEGVGPRNRIDYTANQRSDEPPAHNDFKSLGLGRRLDLGIDSFAEKSTQMASLIAHQSQEALLVGGFPRLVTPDRWGHSPDGRSASPSRRNLQRLVSGDAESIESSRETREAAMQNSGARHTHNGLPSLGSGQRLALAANPLAEKSEQKATRTNRQPKEAWAEEEIIRPAAPDSSCDSPGGRNVTLGLSSPRRRYIQRLAVGDIGGGCPRDPFDGLDSVASDAADRSENKRLADLELSGFPHNPFYGLDNIFLDAGDRSETKHLATLEFRRAG